MVVQGLGAGIGGLALLPLASNPLPAGGHPGVFLAWALLMGLAGSWLATWFWSIASARLPLALAAQLIVAETVFGLIFGFVFAGRWPSAIEAGGALLQIAGVMLTIRAFHEAGAHAGETRSARRNEIRTARA